MSYSAFPRFHALRDEESGEVFDAALIGTVLPLVNGLIERLTAGIDVADFVERSAAVVVPERMCTLGARHVGGYNLVLWRVVRPTSSKSLCLPATRRQRW